MYIHIYLYVYIYICIYIYINIYIYIFIYKHVYGCCNEDPHRQSDAGTLICEWSVSEYLRCTILSK